MYYQLQEILKQEIEEGRWLPGASLPSEAELGRILGVSRPVVRKALDILEDDGQVIRMRGKRAVVAEPKFRFEAVGAAAAWAGGVRGTPTIHRVVAIKRATAGGHIARLLGLAPEAEILELTLTQAVGSTAASLTTMFLRPDEMPGLPPGQLPSLDEGGPDALTQLRKRYGLDVVASEVTIEATRTNAFEAELLQIPVGAPAFLLGSLETAPGGRPAGFSRTVVRSDHFRFAAVLRQGPDGSPPRYLAQASETTSTWQVDLTGAIPRR